MIQSDRFAAATSSSIGKLNISTNMFFSSSVAGIIIKSSALYFAICATWLLCSTLTSQPHLAQAETLTEQRIWKWKGFSTTFSV